MILLGSKPFRANAHHPQCNVMIDRFHRQLKVSLMPHRNTGLKLFSLFSLVFELLTKRTLNVHHSRLVSSDPFPCSSVTANISPFAKVLNKRMSYSKVLNQPTWTRALLSMIKTCLSLYLPPYTFTLILFVPHPLTNLQSPKPLIPSLYLLPHRHRACRYRTCTTTHTAPTDYAHSNLTQPLFPIHLTFSPAPGQLAPTSTKF